MSFSFFKQRFDVATATQRERRIVEKRDKAIEEQNRLASDERVEKDFNKASVDMILWDAECGTDIVEKLREHGRKYVKVSNLKQSVI